MPINPVGTWQDANFQTQSGTAYKTAIDNDLIVGKRLADMFAPHASATPNMNVIIDPGAIFVDGVITEKAQQTVGPIPAPTSNTRIDRIVVDALTGNAEHVQGTEGLLLPPTIPDEKIPICQIWLSVGTSAITNALISDERLGVSSSPLSVKDRTTNNVTVSNTTNEVAIFLKSIPGGTLGTNKSLILDLIVSSVSALDNTSFTFRLKYGSASICLAIYNNTGISTFSGAGIIHCELHGDGATNAQAGLLEVRCGHGANGKLIPFNNADPIDLAIAGLSSVDSTAAQNLIVTAQSDSPANSLTVTRALLVKI